MSKPFMVRLGLRMKQLREESGQTISDIAAKTGIRELVLAGLERGRYDDIDCEQLDVIAQAIGVATAQLVCFPEESARAALLDRSRYMSDEEVEETCALLRSMAAEAPPLRRRRLMFRKRPPLSRRSITLLRQVRKCRT